jgi:hypothetical protein
MLLNRSDNLLNFIEGNWGLIGWELETAKTIEDVRNALNKVDPGQQPQPIQVFTRVTKAKATALDIRQHRRELNRLDKDARAAAANQQRCQQSLQKVTWALREANSIAQEKEIARIFEKRNKDHKTAQALYEDLLSCAQSLYSQYEDERAFFAQSEMLRFLLSSRYSFSPVNLANAIAGLPEMGWRQSAKRCSRHQARLQDGPLYWLFKLIRRAISEPEVAGLSLREVVKAKIQKRKGKLDHRALEARRAWYHLYRAIDAVVEERHHPGALPYRILAKYQQNRTHRNSADVLLEEEEELR